jgi:hypothetical protein
VHHLQMPGPVSGTKGGNMTIREILRHWRQSIRGVLLILSYWRRKAKPLPLDQMDTPVDNPVNSEERKRRALNIINSGGKR